MNEAPLRVLLVDDSTLQRAALRAALAQGGVDVVGTACDGLEALAQVQALRPDVVLMDVVMPRLDGLEATRRIMADVPTPILLMSGAENLAADVELGLRALEFGALDLIPKPVLGGPGDEAARRLVARLKLLARVPVISHPRARLDRARAAEEAAPPRATTFHRRARRVVVVAASTGGPSALRVLLGALPADLPAAVVVVQHIDAAFQEGLVLWLDEECPLDVVLGEDDQELFCGRVYVAPQLRYAEVTERRRLALLREPIPAGGHCPSGDRLLLSAARNYGSAAIGVVLTGMGSDGAAGLSALRAAGALTLAQDEASSVIWGMPGAAVQAGAAVRVLPLTELGAALVEALR